MSFPLAKTFCSTLDPARASQHRGSLDNTHLLLLLGEVIYDDTNEQIQCEERTENNEDDKIKVHVQIVFVFGLQLYLKYGER